MIGCPGARVGDEFGDQARAGQGEHGGEDEKHVAPPDEIAEHAAGHLSEQLAQDIARGVARQDRLALVVGGDVADIGHRDRNDPAGRRAGREPRQRKLRQRGRRAADRHQHRGDDGGDGDGAVFAEAVGDRPGDELDRCRGSTHRRSRRWRRRRRWCESRPRSAATASWSPAPAPGWRSPPPPAA